MWILVLTILGSSHHSGQAVNSVSGFQSKESCMVAAQS